jgi:hypothetical protein
MDPIYFYRVDEFVTTFGKDQNKSQSFDHSEFFKGNDLLKCRIEAIKYYNERSQSIQGKSYHLPIAGPDGFSFGKNAAFSIVVNFVEYYNNNEYYDHPILGEDPETNIYSLETEARVFQQLGIDPPL